MRGLFEPFENTLDIDGCNGVAIAVPIDPDFRIMCSYGTAVRSGDKKELCKCAKLFFFAGLPEGVSPEKAAEAMLDFYAKGLGNDIPKDKNKDKKPSKKIPPVFDFSEDERYFLAAFRSEYGINLLSEKMHWFEFGALFLGLPDECKLKRIIGIRSTETAGIKSSSEKQRIIKLQKIFALKCSRKKHYETLGERNAAMRQSVLEDSKKAGREAVKK